MVEVYTLLVLGAVIGGALNVVRGWNNSPESFNLKLTIGGLVTGVIGSLALVNVLAIPEGLAPLGAVVLGIVTGFVSDFSVSKLK